MEEAAKIYRYANDILPAMSIEELMNELVRAEIANQHVEGHQFGTLYRQISLIREEITRRTK